MLFRWSVWDGKHDSYEMLRHSVGTFRACFGNSAQYVVYTDEPWHVAATLGYTAEVRGYDEYPNSLFDFDSKSTWRKWSPAVRVTQDETEVYVDSDVFVVGEPDELRRFCAGEPGDRFLAMQESAGARWCFGRLEPQVPADAPFINAGLIGQQPHANLTEDLMDQYKWWRANVPPELATFHDEQGAVVAALARHLTAGRVELLPQHRYRIVSPRSNSELEDLKGTALIHATHPGHPAFGRFLSHISGYSKAGLVFSPMEQARQKPRGVPPEDI